MPDSPRVAKHVIRLYTTTQRGVLGFGEEKVVEHRLIVMACVQDLSD
jgi:hypothetical protein